MGLLSDRAGAGSRCFVDVREDTLNIDERTIEGAVTRRTKRSARGALCRYGRQMDATEEIAARHGLTAIEDAAVALLWMRNGRTSRGDANPTARWRRALCSPSIAQPRLNVAANSRS
jgi:O-methyltransferase involved in polyketide biosynthesis